MTETSSTKSPPSARALHRRPQISLAFMLGVTLIFAIMMTASLVYGLRVPAVRAELGWLTPASKSDIGHWAHLRFILFTLTAPLILAGLLSTMMVVLQRFYRQNESRF